MFLRLVQTKVKPEAESRVNEVYRDTVIAALQNTPGCLYAGLIKSESQEHEYVSMTLWTSKQDADAYVASGLYAKLLRDLQPVLADASEWKIQLTKDLTVEYAPVSEEPVAESFAVTTASSEELVLPDRGASMHVRLLSLKIRPERMADFKSAYQNEIIPALLKVKGCRYAFLTESMGQQPECISMTIWDSAEDADHYESGGVFRELIGKTESMFTELFQWKMKLAKSASAATSDDMRVAHYDVVAGRSF